MLFEYMPLQNLYHLSHMHSKCCCKKTQCLDCVPTYGLQICPCSVNGCFMATSVTRMGIMAIKPWLTCTEKAAIKPACFWSYIENTPSHFILSLYLELTMVSDEILLRHWAKINAVCGETLCLPAHGNYYVCVSQIKAWGKTICLYAMQI